MGKFGMSVAVVCALTAPAWGSDPLQPDPDGMPPPPAGYRLISPALVPVDFTGAPDMLPPLARPTTPWAAPPSGAPPADNGCGYAFDPCGPHQRRRRGGGVVHGEYWI